MQNRNLFHIELENIKPLLADANRDLISKHAALVEKISGIPDEIGNEEEANLIKDLLKEINFLKKEWSASRLEDGRPFTNATKLVKEWFRDYEDYLNSKTKIVNQKLTDFAIKQQKVEVKDSGLWQKLTGKYDSKEVEETDNEIEPNEQDNAGLNVSINLKWQVKDYDRDAISLEELKYYFTDNCIRMALKKHLQENETNKLKGVSYEQIAE